MAASHEHLFETRLVWTGASKGAAVDYATYSRDCRVDMAGKPSLAMTSAAVFRGDPSRHDPEGLLVASLSACHFLSYIAICVRQGIQIVTYEDEAVGVMSRVERTFRFTDVLLRPRVTIAAGGDPEKAKALHENAHRDCFIANSVNFPVRHEPVVTVAATV
ncbi:MAG: OsmC family protein [Hyphomicrobiales bacterium]